MRSGEREGEKRGGGCEKRVEEVVRGDKEIWELGVFLFFCILYRVGEERGEWECIVFLFIF